MDELHLGESGLSPRAAGPICAAGAERVCAAPVRAGRVSRSTASRRSSRAPASAIVERGHALKYSPTPLSIGLRPSGAIRIPHASAQCPRAPRNIRRSRQRVPRARVALCRSLEGPQRLPVGTVTFPTAAKACNRSINQLAPRLHECQRSFTGVKASVPAQRQPRWRPTVRRAWRPSWLRGSRAAWAVWRPAGVRPFRRLL